MTPMPTRRNTHWTDPMITLTLPAQNRRALLRGFWLTLAALSALPWWAGALWYHPGALFGVGVAAAVIVAAVPLYGEGFAWRVYRAWNARLVRPCAALVERILLRVCFFIMFAASASGRLGNSDSGRMAAWTERGTLPTGAYYALFGSVGAGASGRWIRDYLAWASRTRHLWSVALLPFLVVLRWLPREADTTPDANIYTLF